MIIRRPKKDTSLLFKIPLNDSMDGRSEGRKIVDYSGRHFREVLTKNYKCKDPWCVCCRLGHTDKARNLRGQTAGAIT